MSILAINGSSRKNWNTATLLNKALEGAASEGAKTELIHLYEIDYKGCTSCFACKLIDGKSYGKCGFKDGLTPVLEKIANANAVILGSPIYFSNVAGQMRSLIERMLFPYLAYDTDLSSLFKKKIPIGFIYTMNHNENKIKELDYKQIFSRTEMHLEKIFGSIETIYVTDTYQFTDYSKYVSTRWNEEAKATRRKEVFPKDCQEAFEMGVRFAQSAK